MDNRTKIKRKHKNQQVKARVKEFDRAIESLMKRERTEELEEILRGLMTARDTEAQKYNFSSEKTES